MRALAELAMVERGTWMRTADLAERTGVPEAYLAKILRRLVACGLLHGQKGHHGGFKLARSAERIRFLDVLRALDALPSPNQCAFGWARCNASKPCPLHPAWSELNDACRRRAGGRATPALKSGLRRARSIRGATE
jgi:Rrf2 family protein